MCTFTYFTMLYTMMLAWYLAAIVALSASAARGALDRTQDSLLDYVGASPSLRVAERPSAGLLGSYFAAAETDALRTHNLITTGELEAYWPDAQRLLTPTVQKYPNPPFRTARFCYALIHMAERGEVIVKLPRAWTAKPTAPECYNADFPTRSDNLGSAEIVLDLNHPSDATKTPMILDFSVSPGDEKIAYSSTMAEDDVPTSDALSIKSLVGDVPPLLLSQSSAPPLIWDQDDLIFMARSESTQELQVLRYETNSNSTTVMYTKPFSAGEYVLSATKSYFFIASYALAKSQMMIARRSVAAIEWRRIVQVPFGMYFWTEELEEGIVLGQRDPNTAKRSLMSYIPSNVLDSLLSSRGKVLETKYIHQFEHSTSPLDIGVRTNGKCLLRHQVDVCSGRHKLIAHSVEGYTDNSGKQSTMLSESFPVSTGDLPVEDHLLSSIETPKGSTAALFYLGVMHAAQTYSFNCSTNSLVLERIIDHDGFNAEPYHESVERTVTPNGLPVSWTLVYRKDMVKKDGANPLIFFPDFKRQDRSSNMGPIYLRGMVELLDKGFILALARLGREQDIHRSSLLTYLDAISRTADQLKTVINRATQLNLTSIGRVGVVASKRVALSLAVLINNRSDLVQAAVMGMAPLSIEALLSDMQVAIKSPTAKRLSQSLDSTKNLPLKGISTNILVLETSPSSASANSALEYVSALNGNTNNTGLALLSVPFEGHPSGNQPKGLLDAIIVPFLLRTLCPSWLVNKTCV